MEKIPIASKYLILTPGKNAKGGISNYYSSIREFLPSKFEYFERGSRTWPKRSFFLNELFRLFKDFIKFHKKIKSDKISIVQTTTSFTSFSLIRDAIFIAICKANGIKVIVFFRGWNDTISQFVNRYLLRLFKYCYFRSDAIIDLSYENSKRLKAWGYLKPIFLETTTVNDNMLEGINESFILEKTRHKNTTTNILYLARIEKRKGIYEALETIRILQNDNFNIFFTIAGENLIGDDLYNKLKEQNIKNYSIEGFVNGNNKIELLKNADIFLFPSYYEGMPNSVLEAMAFGLPVVTRSVGGLQDFFINSENGFITDSKDPSTFAMYIKDLLSNKDLSRKIALKNYKYSQERFKSSIVSRRISKIFETIEN